MEDARTNSISDGWLKDIAWALSGIVTVLAIVVWGQSLRWHLTGLSIYQIFPVFGLVAFSLMWSHYMASALRQWLGRDKAVLAQYFAITSWVVLIAICLHPGLLAWQLGHDGFGWPPSSYLYHFVTPSLRWVALLGITSWFVFVAYEFRRLFATKAWWPIMQYASDVAMIAIFYHGLRLGQHTHIGWFHVVWVLYGVSLVGALGYIYIRKFTTRSESGS